MTYGPAVRPYLRFSLERAATAARGEEPGRTAARAVRSGSADTRQTTGGHTVNALLPPGQRESDTFHRFGQPRFAERFPSEPSGPSLTITGAVSRERHLVRALDGLSRVEQISDFHCVTTWSVRGLRWEGVRFAEFYARVVVPHAAPSPGATLVALYGQDGACTGMVLEDLLADDVLLADRLNGEPLSIDHGAPLRLVAPAHYGYKSVKHLSRIEFREPASGYRVSGLRFMDHPRARVVLEERGRSLPGWFLRFVYRPLIRTTASRFAKAAAKRQEGIGMTDGSAT
ncbi:MAG: molybdopterin-dependent oxidoreductase [Gemmatimonadetes bacterium]|nr:molybdopterin-dependent oxidoreductase [Gemmatimonadota bacterium]